MKLLIFLIFSTLSTSLYAVNRTISIDELSCGTSNYENVSVSFDANEVMADKISQQQVCSLLEQKFRRLHHRASTRIYPGDEQASLINSHIKRANDFLDIFLFKPALLGKTKFINWDGDFTELVMKVRETTNAKVFIYLFLILSGIELKFYVKQV